MTASNARGSDAPALSLDGGLLIGWTALIGLLVAGQQRIGPVAAGDVAAIAALAAFAVAFALRQGRWTRTALDPLIAVWSVLSVGWCLLGLHRQAISPSPYGSMLYGGGPAGPAHIFAVQLAACACYYLAVWSIEAISAARSSTAPIATAIEIAGLLALAACIAEPIRLHNPSARIEAGFTNANLLGAFLVLLIPTIASRLAVGSIAIAPRILRLCLVAGLLGALAMTRSRGAEAGIIVAAALAASVWMRQASSPARRAVLAGGALVAAVALVYLGVSRHGLGDYLDHSRSDQQRQAAWRAGWMLTARYPVTGVGLGGFPAAMVQLGLREPNPDTPSGLPAIPALHVHAHNIALQAGAERGVAGIALLLIAGGILLRKISGAAPATIGAAAAVTAWIVQSAVDYTAWLPAVAILLAVQIAQLMMAE